MNGQPTSRTFSFGLDAVLPLLAAAGIEDASHVESAELLFETNAVATLTVVEKTGTEVEQRAFSFHDPADEGICFGVLPAKPLLAQLGIQPDQPLQRVCFQFGRDQFPAVVAQAAVDDRQLALDWDSLGQPRVREVLSARRKGWR